MKKIILTPSSDSVTLCFPSEWIGKTICCTLQEVKSEMPVVSAAESDIEYQKQELEKGLNKRSKTDRKSDL
jgi:hypothetical protein